MNTRYCSSCGAPNKWDVQKPKFCSKCGNDMDSAFKVAISTTITASQPKQQVSANQRVTRRFFDAYGNDVTDQFIKQAPRIQRTEGDEDYVDEYEKNQLANELAASINLEDFAISLEGGESKSVKLGSIIRQVASNQPTETAKKRSRKKTNG